MGFYQDPGIVEGSIGLDQQGSECMEENIQGKDHFLDRWWCMTKEDEFAGLFEILLSHLVVFFAC
jgi:hypothetical protein